MGYGDGRHQRAAQFLVEEAHLLDTGEFEGWLALLHPEIRYRMPVRVTTMAAVAEADVATMDHFDEDWYSLAKRVARLRTEYAWTEDPRSRTRHHVSNLRTFATDDGDLVIESALLLYRSRGDRMVPSMLSAGRTDRLVEVDGELKLRSRDIEVDESVLRTQNLAIFL